MGESSSEGAEYHVVEQVRSVRGDSVWVTWLGYPKSRNTWRSLEAHFPATSGGSGGCSSIYGEVLASQSRVKVSVRQCEEEERGETPILQGRKPIARDIRAIAAAAKPVAVDRPASEQPAAKRAKRKAQQEVKVHTIRICSDGIHEVRGMKRTGVKMAEASLVSNTSAANSASAEGEAACNFDAVGGPLVGGARAPIGGSKGACSDERSELWATHRLLNESSWQMPKGHMFRLEASELSDSQVTLRWVFPTSSPGDASAWLGLWDANGEKPPPLSPSVLSAAWPMHAAYRLPLSTCLVADNRAPDAGIFPAPPEFNWAVGDSRPRYVRYKSLTSTRQEGTIKFGPKEWIGVPDGEYVFSVDTGGVPCGAGDSRSYCVSQVKAPPLPLPPALRTCADRGCVAPSPFPHSCTHSG
jgi:hypothetical protein